MSAKIRLVPPPISRPSSDSVIDSLPEPVIVVDAGSNISYLNNAAQTFLQGSEAVLAGMNLQDLIPQDSPILTMVDRARRANASMTVHGVRLTTPRIGNHTISVDAAPLLDDPESIVLTVKEHSIAGKIDHAMAQQGAVRSVTALAAMLAHEVKNPLSGIRGAAQLIETMIPAEDRQLTKLITEETDRIVKLLNGMEIFSDRPQLDRSPVNIHEVLDRVLAIARNGFAQNMRLIADFDPSLPPIYGDHDQLIQIFLNLVKNAAEAMVPNGPDPEIVVTTAYKHGVRLAVPGKESRMHLPLVVTIRDNGGGIPDDLRPHLFDPFITTKSNGTGLGLALVAKLVSEHGGVIDFESKPRRTVFTVMLPVLRDMVGSEKPKPKKKGARG
ncbi:PAS domain-containing protein [Rhodospirillaceae bacterium KN72]|uniref:histidine kinase n=1 Tax=Pacificispira spongiicola TaxID=2729598 RepID=A0A7Y0E2G2_9PROT|nr:ATP-binding protein [Pacificispira spongiicola]NMM45990.1 PAS domain-containing protein [Pacificispira spongiicola]